MARPTKYDHAEIKKLLLAGVKYADIAQEVGCHWATVRNIAREMGVKRKKRLDYEPIKKRILAGDAYQNIAFDENCHRATVNSIALERGIRKNRG